MFSKILIANRGEIACRIMRTCRRLGVASVAVYSAVDARARHVALAESAYPIGPAPARDSYLRIDAVIGAAVQSGAQAIHPGYGFLSENADFAEACAHAGIVFIGPPVAAIRAMGSKAEAKALMQAAGVPLVPGYHGAAQDEATLARAAAEIGYPVLIKASAGGGGKGMRVVEHASGLAEGLAGARREAESSFGDGRLLIETYLDRPRHIEIQVFADSHGNCVHLFERDCSIQRRHQKVIEEAPAPFMTPARRAAMGAAAIAACRAVEYVGAGTVEFIVQDDAFYFMEMNTRLQVEHPVTEMVTGQELVEWQLRVACGEALPCTQAQLALHGHAIEARLYAEDPAQEFRPSVGRITHLRLPPRARHVRIDSGVRAGDSITQFYDPMIAKLIVWGADRAEAVSHLRAALAQYEVGGVRTNLALLRAIAAEPDFAAGLVETGFIGHHPAVLRTETAAVDPVVLAGAAWVARAAVRVPPGAPDLASPWVAEDAWRLNLVHTERIALRTGEQTIALGWSGAADGAMRLDLPDGAHLVSAVEGRQDGLLLRLDGVTHRLSAVRNGADITIWRNGAAHVFGVVDAWAAPVPVARGAQADLRAPLPGRVVQVMVAAGEAVAAGAALVVIEAMKMEMTLTAPAAGMVAAVHAAADDMVAEGALLVSFTAPQA